MVLQDHCTGEGASHSLNINGYLIVGLLLRSLANQEVLRWMLAMQKAVGADATHEQIKQYIWKTLNAGQVVPG